MMNNSKILKSLKMVWESDPTNPLVKGYLSQPGLPRERQTAIYEVRKFNGDKAQCFYKGKTYSIFTEWLMY
jgi:hypothetical protein